MGDAGCRYSFGSRCTLARAAPRTPSAMSFKEEDVGRWVEVATVEEIVEAHRRAWSSVGRTRRFPGLSSLLFSMWGCVRKHLRLTPRRSPPQRFPHPPCKCQVLLQVPEARCVPVQGRRGAYVLQPGLRLLRWGSAAVACEVKASIVTKSLLVSFLMF